MRPSTGSVQQLGAFATTIRPDSASRFASRSDDMKGIERGDVTNSCAVSRRPAMRTARAASRGPAVSRPPALRLHSAAARAGSSPGGATDMY
jgi:hypothetical protein